MRTFVMGDIHGNHKALLQCLKRSGFDRQTDRLIQLGDVIDGHRFSYECVEELLTIKNLIGIRGNHDDWFRDFIRTGCHPAQWNFGGEATIHSYLKHSGSKHLLKKSKDGFKSALDPKDIPASHKEFFEKQVPFFIDKANNCYIHGGFDRHNSFEGQRMERYMWDRELWSDALLQLAVNLYRPDPKPFHIKTEFSNIFIGHTKTLHWKTDRPMKAFNIYNLDTGAGGNGRLTIMNVDTKEWFQSNVQHHNYE